MGWHGEKKKPLFKIGSTIDPVIARAPCDIIILKDCVNKKFNKILVTIFGNENDAFALETASQFNENGDITAVCLNNSVNKKYVENIIKKAELTLNIKIIKTNNQDAVKEVLTISKGFDLVVLGIKEIHLQRFHRVTPEETIAQNCKKLLVMVKVSKGFLSWAKKII